MEYVLTIIVIFSDGTWIEEEGVNVYNFADCNEMQQEIWELKDPHLDAACVPLSYAKVTS